MNSWLEAHLVCPRDHGRLQLKGNELFCDQKHVYPIVDGVPVMLLNEVDATLWTMTESLQRAAAWKQDPSPSTPIPEGSSDSIDDHVQRAVAGTCGYLYKPSIQKLRRYPIPDIRLPNASGDVFLDIGCNWGRWCVAAARKGYMAVGIEPSLKAVFAARRVAQQLGVSSIYVVADGRYLPFRSASFDVVFSYSVLQHFSKKNALLALEEASRVLRDHGTALIQMPNKFGIRCLYHQFKRRFREPKEFEVRYWTLPELKSAFRKIFGNAKISVDGYFGLGIQAADMDLMPVHFKVIIRSSEILRKISQKIAAMRYVADSLYVTSRKTS